MSISKQPLRLAANYAAGMQILRETLTESKAREQRFGNSTDGGIEPAQTQEKRNMKYWNEMTNEERVAKLPELVAILDDGRSSAFREVLADMLADIATRPADLLLLMRPTRQGKRGLPPRLIKLLRRAEDEIQARGSKMSGWLSALLLENGIKADRIISLRTDAPGIAVQVGNTESDQALIVCERGQWQVRVCGPKLPNGGMVPFESAEDAVRLIARFAAPSLHGDGR